MPIKDKGVQDEYEHRDLPRKNASYFPIDDEWVVHSLRLHKTRKEVLQRYFKQGGADLTTGIRQILYSNSKSSRLARNFGMKTDVILSVYSPSTAKLPKQE